MSAEYPSVPARVLRERGYAQVSAPAYVSIPSGSGSRAEHAEAEQPGALPYQRRKQGGTVAVILATLALLLLGGCEEPPGLTGDQLNPYPASRVSECAEGHTWFEDDGGGWCVGPGEFTNPDAPEWLNP